MKDGEYGHSIVAYMSYLNDMVFNPTDPDTNTTDTQAYKLIFPNY